MKFGTFSRWFITIAVAIVAAFLIYVSVIKAPKQEYKKPVTPVRVSKPYRSNVNLSLELNGYIETESVIPVIPMVSGTVTKYCAKEGAYVEKDQLLAEIDSKPYELQKQQAEAVYLASKATFDRVANLYKSGAVTKQNYDESKAQLDAYKAQLDLADVQLNYCRVTAPVSGTILQADSAEGSIGTSTAPLYVIADLSKLQISINVPEKYFSLVNENQKTLAATVSGNGKTTKAHVDTVAQYISPESKTFKVTLLLDGGQESFRPGMFVSVSLQYDSYENALVIDQKTVNTNGSVYIYKEETSTAQMVKIETIASDDEHVVIDEKWKNTWFITDGQATVLDGQKVTVL